MILSKSIETILKSLENLKCCGNCIYSRPTIKPRCIQKESIRFNKFVNCYGACDKWMLDNYTFDERKEVINGMA